MILTLRNIRGIEAADLDLSGQITAVLGPNGSGKSSVALALAACLTGATTPMTGKKRGHDVEMCREREPKGVAVLTEGQARAMITWPAGKVETLGTPPTATAAAAGLVSLVTMPDKERAAAFAELFATDPTRADLDAALAEAGAETSSDKLWQVIQATGWDSAATAAQDSAKSLKGAWREATAGATWGSDAGQTWTPADWTMALDVVEQAELEADIIAAKEARDLAVGSQAVAGDRRAELERTAALATTAAQQIGKLQGELTQAQAELDELVLARSGLSSNGDQHGLRNLECPDCGAAPLRIPHPLPAMTGNVKLIKVEVLTDEALKAQRLAIAGADGKIEAAKGRLYDVQARLASAKGDADAAAQAKAELAKTPAGGAGAADGPADPDAALRRAEANLLMWRARTRSAELHGQIVRQVAIAAGCGPAGARKRKLDQVLAEINKGLAGLSQAMGCPPVAFDGDLNVAMGGRGYAALSGSEQWRVRALVQLEIARRDGSAMAVLDGADILDNAGRAGLCGALQRAGLTAMVALTANQPGPDLFRQAGLGRSYWIEAGQAVPMDDAAQRGKEKAA